MLSVDVEVLKPIYPIVFIYYFTQIRSALMLEICCAGFTVDPSAMA
ncbi:hypothetical protein GGQ79_004155 [Ochrobactrum pecoris]|uniref:Uncharacterized protein n=1 Tax=Brucella pecoris TaxID=867683 RepID=A0AB34Z023_9HYPH|nr:hypothetical protein [Brucella pecoris]